MLSKNESSQVFSPWTASTEAKGQTARLDRRADPASGEHEQASGQARGRVGQNLLEEGAGGTGQGDQIPRPQYYYGFELRSFQKDNDSLRKENDRLEAKLSDALTLQQTHESEMKHARERADKAEADRESERQAHFKVRNKLYDQVASLLQIVKEEAPTRAVSWQWSVSQQEKKLDDAIGRGAASASARSRPSR